MISLPELKEMEDLETKIKKVAQSNARKKLYYYQNNQVKDLGINTPVELQGFTIVLGWATMAVDVLAERINWRGYYSPDTENEDVGEVTQWLNKIYRDNHFESEQKLAQKDALITGSSFISVGKGEEGEPEVLWIPENSSTITVQYDRRTRGIRSAFKLIEADDEDDFDRGILWTPEATIEVFRKGSKWEEYTRNDHGSGVVPVVPIFNNGDMEKLFGISEITPSLRNVIDSGMRTFLNAEVNREHYARPYRFIMGLSDEDIRGMKQQGAAIVKTTAGDIITIPENLSGPDGTPAPQDIKEFGANDPMAVMNMLEPIARIAAREMGVPPSYLGFDSVNPSSVDAINAAEAALVKRADDRVLRLKRAYKALADVSMKVAGREHPEGWDNVDTVFKRTDTTTPAATADRMSKMNAVGIFERELPDFMYRELGFSDAEIVEMKSFLRTSKNLNVLTSLASMSTGTGEGVAE